MKLTRIARNTLKAAAGAVLFLWMAHFTLLVEDAHRKAARACDYVNAQFEREWTQQARTYRYFHEPEPSGCNGPSNFRDWLGYLEFQP